MFHFSTVGANLMAPNINLSFQYKEACTADHSAIVSRSNWYGMNNKGVYCL